MKILNIMLSRELGGIQQAFLDYTEALILNGHEVLEVTSKNSLVNAHLTSSNVQLTNLGALDPISIYQLYNAINGFRPEAIIAHGKGMRLALQTRNIFKFDIPIVGVAHNYKPKWLKKCDYVLSITQHLKSYLIQNGIKSRQIFLMPNIIHTESVTCKINPTSKPIIIGMMGRFVPDKGIDVFINALKILRNNGVEFKAIIGGDGPDAAKLSAQTIRLGLQHNINFVGWIENKQSFFEEIDIFCVPSVHEPFGIIVLEGMLYKKPIVCAASEGPSEIITDNHDGLFCPIKSPQIMANKLSFLIHDELLRKRLANNAFQSVCNKYDIKIGANRLSTALSNILRDYHK